MRLIERAVMFWKLATTHNLDKQYYDDWIRVQLPTAGLDDIQVFITNNSIREFVDIKDFLPRIYQTILRLDDDLPWIRTNFGKWALEIILYILDKWVKDHTLTVKDYLMYEEFRVAPALLREAQNNIIKKIITQLQSDNEIANRNGAQAISKLLDDSNEFNHDFLISLVKRYGVENYLYTMKHMYQAPSIINILSKPKLTVFDVAYLLKHKNYIITGLSPKEFMLKIIAKSDEKAKEYIRGFLYWDSGAEELGEGLFMLDTDMKPIDRDYKTFDLPEHFERISLSAIQPIQLQDKWRQMFNEFQIIPQ